MTDTQVRFLIFFSALLFLSTLEFFFSYRKRELSRSKRWPANFSLIIISSLAVKVLLPTGLIYFSTYTNQNGLGLLNILKLPHTINILFAIVLLDFSIYIQHILFHKIQFLWRFHRVHHADIDLDTTSALRFHPLEILISIGYKIGVLFLLGVSAEAILIFEIILNLMAMFNHSNLHLPASLEKLLRWVIVTPQMHIIHHSTEQFESDTNYGFNLSIWDRLFKSYTKDFQSEGLIGQTYYRSAKAHSPLAILLLPFKNTNNTKEPS